jgi:hypothetical protein
VSAGSAGSRRFIDPPLTQSKCEDGHVAHASDSYYIGSVAGCHGALRRVESPFIRHCKPSRRIGYGHGFAPPLTRLVSITDTNIEVVITFPSSCSYVLH